MGKTKSKVKKKKRRMLDAAIKNGTPPSKVLGKKVDLLVIDDTNEERK
jgi:hypothetical protein